MDQRLFRRSRIALVAMADTPHIEGRLRALLNDSTPRHVIRGALLGAIVGAALVSIPLAALRPAPAQTSIASANTREQLTQIETQLRRIEDQLQALKGPGQIQGATVVEKAAIAEAVSAQSAAEAAQARDIERMQLDKRRAEVTRQRMIIERSLADQMKERQLVTQRVRMLEEEGQKRAANRKDRQTADTEIARLKDALRLSEIRLTVMEDQFKELLRKEQGVGNR